MRPIFGGSARRAEVDELAELVDAGAIVDLELGLPERRRDLVLHDLGTRAAGTTAWSPFFHVVVLTDVEAHRSVRT